MTINNFFSTFFPPYQYPSIEEMHRNVSLAFTNYHFTQGNPRANVPGMIDIGGIQVKDPPAPLPDTIQKWLDDAPNGAVYMSMGTNIRSSELSIDILNAILNTFATLKERVIWKFENDSLPGLPSNVIISKWLPQDDLLAHKNIKLFITHGGLGGIIEARYHGVPLLGIPFFADQMGNLENEVKKGVAQIVNYVDLTQETFSRSMHELLLNPMYRETAKQISEIFRDRPVTPMDTAVFWTEYVLRHHGAKHMQAHSAHLNFWQLNSYDVIGVLLAVAMITLLASICVLKIIWIQLFGLKIKSKKE